MIHDDIERQDEMGRELFEKWFRVSMYVGADCMVDAATKRRIFRAWQAAWQASRAALVVELPVKRSDANRHGNYVPAVCEAYDEAIDDCADAIRDAGISVKGADTER